MITVAPIVLKDFEMKNEKFEWLFGLSLRV